MGAEARLAALDLVLPPPPAPAGLYRHFTRAGELLFIAGQIPFVDGRVHYCGPIPSACAIEDARRAAERCMLNVLAVGKLACAGDLDRLLACLRLEVFVHSDPDFYGQAGIADAACALLLEILGESGRAARFTIGASVLPLNASVEIAAIFQTAPFQTP